MDRFACQRDRAADLRDRKYNAGSATLIARVLSLDKYGSPEIGGNEVRKIQVELGGHVFVSQRRVGRRSPWHLRFLGVLAELFDLRKVHLSETSSHVLQASTDDSEVELGLMRE